MIRKFVAAVALTAGFSTAAFAQVEGKVTFAGDAPARKPLPGIMNDANCGKLHKTAPLDESVLVGKGGELANVVVYLKGDGLKGDAPADEVVLDQVNCIYTPHVVSVTVGQKLIAVNSDPFLHNVHTLPETNAPINKASRVRRTPFPPRPPRPSRSSATCTRGCQRGSRCSITRSTG
jgi:plastocyanin